MDFPAYRPRRLRRNEKIRELVRETTLSPKNFIYPIFVGPGKNRIQAVSSMPGVAQLSVDRAVLECEEAQALGTKTPWARRPMRTPASCNRRSALSKKRFPDF